ncbi:MAG TPA: 3-hydroxybutyrate dehydrogenase [bacterium]|nr:3-hydroxybutyrate dehydrogenase [bacterium]
MPAWDLSVAGKAAVVTGAGSGIGRATALALAAGGAALCAVDLRPDTARAVAGEIERAGGRAIAAGGDVSKSEDVQRFIGEAVRGLGRLDILVNNAGLQYIAPIHEYPEEKWNLLIGVMLTGTFLCTKYALPHMMKNRWGRVLNLASIHGVVASPFKSAYTAAKHGIVGFTRCLALEVGGHGITANAICPAYVRTPLVEGQIADQAKVHGISPQQVVEKIMLEPAAVKRLLEPDEIAGAIRYLCSDLAGGVTGTTFLVDEGWTAH